jgi:hypothetical protein
MSQDSYGLRAGRPGFDAQEEQEIFLFFVISGRDLLSSGCLEGSFSGCEADRLPPSCAEVKNDGAIPLLHHTSP